VIALGMKMRVRADADERCNDLREHHPHAGPGVYSGLVGTVVESTAVITMPANHHVHLQWDAWLDLPDGWRSAGGYFSEDEVEPA